MEGEEVEDDDGGEDKTVVEVEEVFMVRAVGFFVGVVMVAVFVFEMSNS